MRKLLLLSGILIFFFPVMSQAQNAEPEMQILRRHLGVPDKTVIDSSGKAELPQANPLKIFIATGLDLRVRDNFEKWVEKWNKSSGKKKGMLQTVSVLNQADIILSRRIDRNQIHQETRPVFYDDVHYSYFRHTFITIPIGGYETYTVVPVYAYILRREPGHLIILSRYVDETAYGESSISGKSLWDEFKKLMEKRYKLNKGK
jgi:hypothetical protein